jgi:hypothetical protein
MFTVKVCVVSTFTLLNDAGLVEDIVPMSVVGNVIVPSSATANAEIVISPQAKVGVADCIAVVVQVIVLPAFDFPSGTKIDTVSSLVVSVFTISKEAGLVEVIVPTFVEGSVIVPSCATEKPLKVTL